MLAEWGLLVVLRELLSSHRMIRLFVPASCHHDCVLTSELFGEIYQRFNLRSTKCLHNNHASILNGVWVVHLFNCFSINQFAGELGAPGPREVVASLLVFDHIDRLGVCIVVCAAAFLASGGG